MSSDSDEWQYQQMIYARVVRAFGDQYALYERGGLRYPVVVLPPDDAQRADVDSILGSLLPETEERADFAFYDQAHVQAMQARGRRLEDNPTYTFAHLETSPLKIHARLGRYFNMLATCDALDRETRAHFSQPSPSDLLDLPYRAALAERVPPKRALYDGRGRSAALGVAALTVLNDAGTYKLLLARRSQLTATDPGFYHVLPAFVFQPVQRGTPHLAEYSVARQVYREFLEEFYGLPEGASPHEVEAHPLYQELRQQGAAALYLTGLSFNVLTQRHEICTLLLIHNMTGHNRAARKAAWETEQGAFVLAPLASDEALLAALPPALHTRMPPQGSAALWLGVDYARALLQREGHA